MSKILVTGSEGFLGKHLVKYLTGKGNEVFGVDIQKGIDIRDLSQLESVFRSFTPDYVVHLAAVSRTPHANESPNYTLDTNVSGTGNVLEASKRAKVKKVILASSNIIYGVDNMYKLSKLTVEGVAHVYDTLYGLKTLCLRFANIAGEDQHPDNFLMALSKSKKDKGYITIFGSGEQQRDIVYQKDVCEAIEVAMLSDVHDNNIDICTGKMNKLNDIAKMFNCEIKYIEARQGDTTILKMEGAEKAKELLDWEAKYSLEDFIKIYTN